MLSAAPGFQISTILDRTLTDTPDNGPANVGTQDSGFKDGVTILKLAPNCIGSGVLNSAGTPSAVNAV